MFSLFQKLDEHINDSINIIISFHFTELTQLNNSLEDKNRSLLER